MKTSRTPWTAKLKPDMKPEVIPDAKGRGRMLLPTPLLVAEEIATLPEGTVISVSTLRLRLAKRFDADVTCPLMTGIFFNLVAGAAEERLAEGKAPLTPYWRVIRDDGSLSPKTPQGPEVQARHLQAEGHRVVEARGKWKVSVTS